MSKKTKNKKKVMDINEQVGDTSGYSEKDNKLDNKRKTNLFLFLGGIVILVVFAIIFLTSPMKASFRYQDNATQTARHQISKETLLLVDAPDDPTRLHYEFSGWYRDISCTNPNGGLFNNSTNNNLLKYSFNRFNKNYTFYAKWMPVYYKINYDVKGNAQIGQQTITKLENQNASNIQNYTIKHEALQYEINDYVDYLRKTYPDIYIKSAIASQNIQNAITQYTQDCVVATLPINDISMDGYTFLGWFDEDGNKVTQVNKLDPKELNLTAKWEKKN